MGGSVLATRRFSQSPSHRPFLLFNNHITSSNFIIYRPPTYLRIYIHFRAVSACLPLVPRLISPCSHTQAHSARNIINHFKLPLQRTFAYTQLYRYSSSYIRTSDGFLPRHRPPPSPSSHLLLFLDKRSTNRQRQTKQTD